VGHEVKGIAFASVHHWLDETFGPPGVERLCRGLAPETAAAIRRPMPSVWYDEGVHADMLHGIYRDVCDGDETRYRQVIEAVTTIGLKRFARLILSMTTPAFVIHRLPTLWRILRRGPATVGVREVSGMFRVTYDHFEYFDDETYHGYLIAVVRAIILVPTEVKPDIVVSGFTPTRLTLQISLRHDSLAPPS
jgi:hypothetical protein